MNTLRLLVLGLVLWLDGRAGFEATAQFETLREAVIRESGPVEKKYRVIQEPQSIGSILAVSDIVVRGTVGPQLMSYLTQDGSDVRTDYQLRVAEVLVSPRAPAVSEQSQMTDQLVLTQRGGTVTIEGHHATVRHVALPPLRPGTEVVMFLVRAGDKYEIAKNYFGAFSLSESTVIPLAPRVFDDQHRRGLTFAAFRNEIATAAVELGR